MKKRMDEAFWKLRWKDTQRNKRQKTFKKHEQSLRELWDNLKQNNICIVGIPEEKKVGKG